MRNKTMRVAFLGVMTAVAMILSYVEAILPPIVSAVPGVKIGLPNILIIFVLYRFSVKEAAAISLVRVFLSALLFGNAMTLAYSTAGAVFSIIIMSLLKKTDKFTAVGVSISGGVAHNLGQIFVAVLLLNSTLIAYYMLILTFTGVISGIIVGVAGGILAKKVPERIIK